MRAHEAHVLLTAGLRNPTVRLRYLAARALLDDYRLPDVREELLGLLGCARLPPERAGRHLVPSPAVLGRRAEEVRRQPRHPRLI